MPSGFLLIDKPAGITSHDVIDHLRRITGIKKIGHAGTLDPFATGLLLVGVGSEATTRLSEFVGLDKEYQAKIRLGGVSDTHDRCGEVKMVENVEAPSFDLVKEVVKNFIGEQKQTPPMFSAKKIHGQKLYELARRGEVIERQPVGINVYSLEIIKYEWPHLEIMTHVSSGTYIRQLGADIGAKLGVGGYLEELRRTSIGDFLVENAHNLEKMGEHWEKSLINPIIDIQD